MKMGKNVIWWEQFYVRREQNTKEKKSHTQNSSRKFAFKSKKIDWCWLVARWMEEVFLAILTVCFLVVGWSRRTLAVTSLVAISRRSCLKQFFLPSIVLRLDDDGEKLMRCNIELESCSKVYCSSGAAVNYVEISPNSMRRSLDISFWLRCY